MSIQTLIDDLSKHGVNLTFHEGQIEVSGAREAVSADLVSCLRSNKPAIFKYLADELLQRAANAVPGISVTDLRANLDDQDWQDPDLIAYEPLKALAHAIRNSRSVLAGP